YLEGHADLYPGMSYPDEDQTMAFPAGIPAGWKMNGEELFGPKGEGPVIHGIQHLVTRGWDPENVPLTPEIATPAPVNPLDPHSGHGVQQYFKKTVVVWDSETGNIYKIPAGQLANYYRTHQASAAPATPAQPLAATVPAEALAKEVAK